MPDSYETFLDEQRLKKEGQAKATTGTDPYSSFIDTISKVKRNALPFALDHGSQQNPDEKARNLQLAKHLQLPVETIEADPANAHRLAKLGMMDLDALRAEAPNVAKWLEDPNNAAIAHDDVDGLRQIERTARALTPGQPEPDTPELRRAMDMQADAIWQQIDAYRNLSVSAPAPIGPGSADGGPTSMMSEETLKHPGRRLFEDFGGPKSRDDVVNIMRASMRLPDLRPGQGLVTAFSRGLGRGTAMLASGLLGEPSIQDDIRRNDAEFYRTYRDPSFGESLIEGVSGSLPMLGAMMASRGRVAGALSRPVSRTMTPDQIARLSKWMVPAEITGLSLAQNVQDREQTPEEAILNALLEGAFTRAGGTFEPFLDAAGTTGGKFIKEVGKEILEEGGTAGSQDIVSQKLGKNPKAYDFLRTLEATGLGAAAGGIMAGSFGIPRAMADRYVQKSSDATEAKNHTETLEQLVDQMSASKTGQRAPDEIATLVETTLGQGAVVFVDAAQFRETFDDPVAIAQSMGIGEDYAAALATDGQVQIPTVKLLQMATTDARAKGLLKHLRRAPGAQTATEADEFIAKADDALRQLQSEAKAQATEGQADPLAAEVAEFEADTFKQADKAAPQTIDRGALRDSVRVFARGIGNLAKSEGKTIAEIVKLQVKGELQRALKGEKFDLMDAMIERVRKQEIPTAEEASQSEQGRDLLESLDTLATAIREAGADVSMSNKEIRKLLAEYEERQGEREVGQEFDQAEPDAAPMPDTIEIDGKQRPTLNSNGKRIAQTEEQVRNFWRWFGDSRVVDKQGRPLVLYHGTKASFDRFRLSRRGLLGPGAYLTDSRERAAEYGDGILEVYLSASNPLVVEDYDSYEASIRSLMEETGAGSQDEALAARDIDSITMTHRDGVDWVAIQGPHQIKSATGNRGTFDPSNPSILAQGTVTAPKSGRLDLEALLKQWRKATGDRTPIGGDAAWQQLVEQSEQVEADGRELGQGPNKKGTPTGTPEGEKAGASPEGEPGQVAGVPQEIMDLFSGPVNQRPVDIRDLTGEQTIILPGERRPQILFNAFTSLVWEDALRLADPQRLNGPNEKAQELLRAKGIENGYRPSFSDAAIPWLSDKLAGARIGNEYVSRPLVFLSEEQRAEVNRMLGESAENEARNQRLSEREKAWRAILDRRSLGAISETWQKIASDDRAFQFGKGNPRASGTIGRMYGVNIRRDGDDVIVANSRGSLTIHDVDGDEPYIRSTEAKSEGRKRGGGTALYQAAFHWAFANGITIHPDSSLSDINVLRRTSNMLSSALRMGTTRHMLPSPSQGVKWSEDHAENVAALAGRESDLVRQRFPEANGWTIEKDGAVRDESGTALDDAAIDTRILEAKAQTKGVGSSTVKRALITRAINKAVDSGESTRGFTPGRVLYQPGKKDRRASIQFTPGQGLGRKFTINLFKTADASSFLHESGHLFLELFADLAAAPGASESIKADYRRILAWLGADGPKKGEAPVVQYRKTAALIEAALPPVKDGHVRLWRGNRPGEVGSASTFTNDLPGIGLPFHKGYGGDLSYIDVTNEQAQAALESSGAPGAEFSFFGKPEIFSKATVVPVPVNRADITEDQHEQFARGFERYLMEGVAPASNLRRAFARIKSWMVAIYRSVANLNVELTPEIRSVFDRLLAAEDGTVEVEREHGMDAPLPREVFASDEEYQAAAKAFEDSRQGTADRLAGDLLADLTEDRRQKLAAERLEVRSDVTNQVDDRPVYQVIAMLQRGELPDGTKLPDEMQGVKLDKGDLANTWGEAVLKKLPGPGRKANGGPYVYANEGGQPVEQIARAWGFPSGDAMIEAMIQAPDRDTTIEAETDAEMRRRHPDPMADLPDRARAALATDQRAELFRRELSALGKRAGQTPAPLEVLRQVARDRVAKEVAYKLAPDKHRIAAAKAARRVVDAVSRQQWDEAYRAKVQEALALELYRASRDAKEASEAGRTYLRSFDTLAKRERIGKAGGWEWTVYGPDGSEVATFAKEEEAREAWTQQPQGATYRRTNGYLEQIDAVLDGFQLRRASTLSLRRRDAFKAWLDRQANDGEPVDIDPKTIADLGNRNWTDLSVIEQSEVVNAIRNIEKLAQLKNKLLKSARSKDLDEARRDVVGAIVTNQPNARPDGQFDDLLTKAMGKAVGFIESHRKDGFLARRMDGDQDGGAVWDYLIRSRNEAAGEQETRSAKESVALSALFKAWGKQSGARLSDIPGTRLRMTLEQRIALALNWGNQQGRQRVMSWLGRGGWNAGDAQAVLDSLDAADWKLVNGIIGQINAHWSDVAALEQRTKGIAPEKVEAVPFVTKAGVQPGGYYPIKYDPAKSTKAGNLAEMALAKEMQKAAGANAQTRRGHTKLRAMEVDDLALRFDFGVIGEHLSEVIHDLTHRELTLDQNRLLRDPEISQAIIGRYGRNALDQFVRTATDIATGDAPARYAIERFAKALRINNSAATFGFNLTSALMNLTGFLPALTRVGPSHMLGAFARLFKSDVNNGFRFAVAKSEFMKNRSNTMLREIADATRQVQPGGKVATIRNVGWYPMTQVQRMVDTTVWIAAYEQALAKEQAEGRTGPDADARAVAIADQTVVDTQGSGRIGDLSNIERGGELAKIFTTFYSYFGVMANLQGSAIGRFLRGSKLDPSTWGRAITDTALIWTMPALFASLIKSVLQGDERDDEEWYKSLAREQVSYGMGMLIGLREASGLVEGHFGYSGPAGTRGVAALAKGLGEVFDGDLGKGDAKALSSLVGVFTGLPAVQVNRLIDAIAEDHAEGRDAEAVRRALFGAPRQ